MKRLLAIFMLFVVLLCSTFSFASEEISVFAGGSGTKEDPYKISSKSELDSMRDHPESYFVLTSDIKFTESDFEEGGEFYNSGELWTPVGDENSPFMGHFDGAGHKIFGLKVNMNVASTSYAGLFGVIDSGTVTNLGMRASDVTVTGMNETDEWTCIYAGGIVGLFKNGTIENCSNTGNITVSSSVSLNRVGGIAGGMEENAVIQTCFNSGNIMVSSTENVSAAGGISGDINCCSIKNCYNSGVVQASAKDETYAFAGGIAGEISSLSGETSSIEYCYNAGNIYTSVATTLDSNQTVGSASGIAGSCLYSAVSDCYSIDSVIACVGSDDKNYESVSILTSEEMSLEESFTSFDFENVWETGKTEGYSYPTLIGVEHDSVQIVSVTVSQIPDKTEYIENDELDLTGGQLTVKYDDGTEEIIELTSLNVEGFESSVTGNKTVTVSYFGHTASFTVTVKHDYLETVVEAKCEEGGYSVTTCSQCDYRYEDPDSVVPALGHTEDILPQQEPTCTQTGMTEGSYCSTCGATMIPQEEIPELGHAFSSVTVDADSRVYIKTCDICGEDEIMNEEETVELINEKLNELLSRELTPEDEGLVNDLITVYYGLAGDFRSMISNSDSLLKMNERFLLHNNGDIDFDGIIRTTDLSIMLYHYDDTEECESDLNHDGVVNNEDLSTLLFNYGTRVEY